MGRASPQGACHRSTGMEAKEEGELPGEGQLPSAGFLPGAEAPMAPRGGRARLPARLHQPPGALVCLLQLLLLLLLREPGLPGLLMMRLALPPEHPRRSGSAKPQLLYG